MKQKYGLNHWYYSGQTFSLEQRVMNEMIEDIRKLVARCQVLEDGIQQMAAMATASNTAVWRERVIERAKELLQLGEE